MLVNVLGLRKMDTIFMKHFICLSNWISYVMINKKLGCKNVNIFLSISFNMCFGCSQEPSHGDGSFEYPQHMFWFRNKKINF